MVKFLLTYLTPRSLVEPSVLQNPVECAFQRREGRKYVVPGESRWGDGPGRRSKGTVPKLETVHRFRNLKITS